MDCVYLLEGMTRKKRQEMIAWFQVYHPQIKLPTIWRLMAKMEKLTGIKPLWFHCCKNSCMAYTGEYSQLTACRICHTPRYDTQTWTEKSRPLKRWLFLPLLPRLKHQFSGKYSTMLSTYRAEFGVHDSARSFTKDIFSGRVYQTLLRNGNFPR